MKASDLDPVFCKLNESLTSTRAQLAASKAAADDAWATLQESSNDAIATMRTGIDEAWSTLDESEST